MRKHVHFQKKNNNHTLLSMINNMAQRYETYKDSGVQWLGEIPEHWKTVRSRYILRLQTGSSKKQRKIGLENIEGFTGRYLSTDTKFDGDGVDFYIGDIVYGKLRPYLCKVWLAEFDGNAVGDFYVYRMSDDYYNAFAKYIMLSNKFTDVCNASTYGAKMPRVSHQFISSLMLPVPPLSEQHSIVSYLDAKCGMIDKMLEGKKKQIELLGEMKQRIIADAVTRGLNPDVKLKDTNILWLPQIPEHWELLRNKSFLSITDEKVGQRKNITLLSLTKQGVIVRDLSEGKGKFPNDFDTYLVVRPNNLVFCLFDIDETPRTVGLVRNYGMLTGAYTNFEVNKEFVLPEYAYHYYLQVDDVKGLRPYYTGLRKVVKTNTFLQLRMPVPPLSEQRAIVNYINERTSKIETLTQKLQQEIDNIKEYKQRLISDVVTGQIKVC